MSHVNAFPTKLDTHKYHYFWLLTHQSRQTANLQADCLSAQKVCCVV